MRTWTPLALSLGLQLFGYAAEGNVRSFRAVDPDLLDAKVPRGFGKIFVEAGRQNNIDPLILAAISAHESGAWKSRAARLRNNWSGAAGSRRDSSHSARAPVFYST